MSKRGDREFLCDIKEAIERIKKYIGKIDYEGFLKDFKTQDAVVRNLEIIGEAVKNLSNTLKKRHSDIEWKDIAGMRDKIIHHYFGIKWDIVWSVVKDKLPELKESVEGVLNKWG
ncbi:MAG: DUF86 domain-containing protein [Planctomycetes bacterium]|nr:DUF86 domain-containing protein [Planctomycetota bacterium]